MKKQKIFDIVPPTAEQTKQPTKQPKAKQISLQKRKSSKKPFIFVLFTLVFIILFSCLFIEGNAKIEIWPETQLSSFNTDVVVGELQSTSSENFILGEILKTENIVSQEFSSTGKIQKKEKAKGTIRIYNNYKSSQSLVINTRFWFISKDNKVREFKLTKWVTIPKDKYRDVEVIASEAGEKYNIGPSTFSIPGLRGTARYTAVYGESFSPMKGGLEKEVIIATKEDIARSERILKEKAKRDSKNSLLGKITSDKIFLDKAIQQEILEISSLVSAGQEARSFVSQAKVRTKTIVLKKSALENFVLDFISSKMLEDREFYGKSLILKHSLKESQLEKNRIVLTLNASVKSYSKIEQKFLKEKIKGKNINLASKIILDEYPEIINLEIRDLLFWKKSFPKQSEKIQINLMFD
ncbi:MAG: hypothetical protein U9P88_00035 [Patescibacteria group bacterium]|nr:hypothetical protein [Patescibacteria group bacterium]